MEHDPKDNIKNIGIGGFLIKKTVQPFSLREPIDNPSRFKSSNMTIFINKKWSEIRKRLGTNQIPSNLLFNPCLRVKILKKSFFEMKKEAYEKIESQNNPKNNPIIFSGKKLGRCNSAITRSKSFHEQNNKPKIEKPHIQPIEQLFKALINNISEDQLQKYFLHYNSKLKEKKGYKEELEKYALNYICNKFQISIPNILGINKDFLKYPFNEIENTPHLKFSKRLSSIEIDEMITRDLERNQKNVAEEFNATRLEARTMQKKKKKSSEIFFSKLNKKNQDIEDNFFNQHIDEINDLIKTKNEKPQSRFIRKDIWSLKMYNYKRKKEKIINEIEENINKNDNNLSFITENQKTGRTNRSVSFKEKKINKFNNESKRNLSHSDKKETSKTINQFMFKCNQNLTCIKEENKKIEENFQNIQNLVYSLNNNEISDNFKIYDKDFNTFLEMRKFKNKLVGFLLENIIDPVDILSQIISKRRKENIIKNIINI